MARRFGVNPNTVAKWRKRSSVADQPTGPKAPRSTTLSAEQEAIIVAFRRHTLLPLDDCLYALQATIPHSTGGRTTLLGISKRGSSYLRRLLVHGARSCVMHLDRSRDRLGGWIDGLEKRMHGNKMTVALAAKIARVAWVVMTKPGASYERRHPAMG